MPERGQSLQSPRGNRREKAVINVGRHLWRTAHYIFISQHFIFMNKDFMYHYETENFIFISKHFRK